MALKEQISDDIKTAMKARDKERTGVLRLLLSEIKYAQVAEGASDTLKDEEVLAVVATYAKRLRKAIVDFQGTDKLPELERELAIIEEYLPKKATKEEIDNYIANLLSTTDEKNFGALMKQVLGHFGPSADGKEVSMILKSKLN
jgi:hypothetical protein